MSDEERIPDKSDQSGALVPAPQLPSTALAAPAPLLPRWDDADRIAAREFFARVVRSTFDALDNVGDSIASAVGLR
jgi:hypothetical protein